MHLIIRMWDKEKVYKISIGLFDYDFFWSMMEHLLNREIFEDMKGAKWRISKVN